MYKSFFSIIQSKECQNPKLEEVDMNICMYMGDSSLWIDKKSQWTDKTNILKSSLSVKTTQEEINLKNKKTMNT